MNQHLRFLTAALPGIGGAIKVRPEDFRVFELPLYQPCGSGTHLYIGIRKRGIPTPAAIDRLGRHLKLPAKAFGAAGLKDAQAMTEQTLSVEHVEPERLRSFRDECVEIVWLSRHTNKLKSGHLAGNRFVIRIREAGEDALPKAQAVLEVLKARGVPNYFGVQRFGARGDNWQLGRSAVAGDLDEFVRLMLGNPQESDPVDIRAARQLFEGGKFDQALRRWPGHYHNERRALAAYVRSGGRAKPAFAAVDKFAKRFFISSFQSHLFNEVLNRRIDEIDAVRLGDLAQKTDSGGVFLVEDLAAELPRAHRFEISPTGPLLGYRVRLAEGEPGAAEQAVLAETGLTVDDWRKAGAHKVKGQRRALRFPIAEVSASGGRDEFGNYVEVGFIAPPGCYATVALREIMKEEPAGEDHGASEEEDD